MTAGDENVKWLGLNEGVKGFGLGKGAIDGAGYPVSCGVFTLPQRHLRTSTRELARSGAVVAVERASSDLKLNSHLRAVSLGGVYVPGANAVPEFRALPRLRCDGSSVGLARRAHPTRSGVHRRALVALVGMDIIAFGPR
jgi:hypothetical protein